MGTPDLLGTYGTFTLFTSEPFAFGGRALSGGTVHAVDIVDGTVQAALEGPRNPFRVEATMLQAPFTAYVDATNHPADRPAELSAVNQKFGRRFQVVSFRWLSRDEI